PGTTTASLLSYPTLFRSLVGKAMPYTRPGTRSAIAKQPVASPIQVGIEGLAGDEQGDPKVHGGVYKAVHHYPYEHYQKWIALLGDRKSTRLNSSHVKISY